MQIVVFHPHEPTYNPLDEYCRQLILDVTSGYDVHFPDSGKEFERVGPKADIFLGYTSIQWIDHLPNTKWFQSISAGIMPEVIEELDKRQQKYGENIYFTNARGVYAPQAAEHAFALLLYLTRGLMNQNKELLVSTWARLPAIEIGGMTLGIIGMGGFGLEMARRGKGFDMDVIAIDPYCTQKPDVVDELLPNNQLDELMKKSDVVMLACPYTKQTHHIINGEMLALMKPSAYLINVTRGLNVDQSALISALENKQIAGAGLDVFETEPLPIDSPLWEMEQVVISPHNAGLSQNRPRLTIELFCRNFPKFLAGEELENSVSLSLGF